MRLQRLRYGSKWTGLELLLPHAWSIGFRWSRRVFGAPFGPWLRNYRSGLLLDAQTIRPASVK